MRHRLFDFVTGSAGAALFGFGFRCALRLHCAVLRPRSECRIHTLLLFYNSIVQLFNCSTVQLFNCSIVQLFCIPLSNVHINLGVVCCSIRTSAFTVIAVFLTVIVVDY
jgi:hypothetical protein